MPNKPDDKDEYADPAEEILRTRLIFLPIPMAPDVAPMELEDLTPYDDDAPEE